MPSVSEMLIDAFILTSCLHTLQTAVFHCSYTSSENKYMSLKNKIFHSS